MPFENLSAFVALLLAVSLAAERLVRIAKTFFPIWLGREKAAADGTEDPLAVPLWNEILGYTKAVKDIRKTDSDKARRAASR